MQKRHEAEVQNYKTCSLFSHRNFTVFLANMNADISTTLRWTTALQQYRDSNDRFKYMKNTQHQHGILIDLRLEIKHALAIPLITT